MSDNAFGASRVGSSIVEVPRITNRQVVYASIVAFLAWMLSVYDFILFGTLLPEIAADFGWSTAFSTFVATWVSVGTFFVALTVGPLIDYVGRKGALVTTTAGAALSSGLAALTFGPIYLIVVRAFSGLGYSEQAVNTTYLSELYGPRRRGFLYSFVQGGWPIGVLFASGMAAALLPLIGWRGVFAVATFPAVLIAILATRLKESPRFVAMKTIRRLLREGQTEDAERLAVEYGVETGKVGRLSYIQLFQGGERRHTIWLSLSFLLNWLGVQVLIVLGTTVLTQGKGISLISALFFLVVSNALAYVGYILHGYVGDFLGRRETILIGWLLSGITYALMLFVAEGTAAVLVTYMFGLFFLIGPYSALFSYMGESYPTRARGTGAAFVNAMGPIGAIVGSALFTTFQAVGYTIPPAAFLAGALPIFLSGLTLLGARRVKPGQVLEEIAR